MNKKLISVKVEDVIFMRNELQEKFLKKYPYAQVNDHILFSYMVEHLKICRWDYD